MLTLHHPLAAAAVVLALAAPPLAAQDLTRYRDFSLGTSLASVVSTSGARAEDAKTLHARPANIQELEWRSLYGRPPGSEDDPVRQVLFTFYEDQLFQIVVTYDDDRTEGLTNADLVGALSNVYGPPVPVDTKAPRKAAASSGDTTDSTPVAQWDDSEASVTLIRGTYSPNVRVVLVSKRLSVQATSAAKEAVRLDAVEAPQRAKAQQAQAVADGQAARDKARATNKVTFRP